MVFYGKKCVSYRKITLKIVVMMTGMYKMALLLIMAISKKRP